jgi:hypothetical protein
MMKHVWVFVFALGSVYLSPAAAFSYSCPASVSPNQLSFMVGRYEFLGHSPVGLTLAATLIFTNPNQTKFVGCEYGSYLNPPGPIYATQSTGFTADLGSWTTTSVGVESCIASSGCTFNHS